MWIIITLKKYDRLKCDLMSKKRLRLFGKKIKYSFFMGKLFFNPSCRIFSYFTKDINFKILFYFLFQTLDLLQ